MLQSDRFIPAAKACGLHFLLSLLLAFFVATLVLVIWYPYPYRQLMGGDELFLLIVTVDVVCGPLLTFVVFDLKKPRYELMRDLGFIGLIQFMALLYGLQTVALARPVHLVFESDRFNAVSSVDVDRDELAKVSAPWNDLPLWGPDVIASRKARDGTETLSSVELSLHGVEPSMRPDWWQPFEASRDEVLKRAKPLMDLRTKHAAKPDLIARIDMAVKESGKPEESLRWLPLTSRRNKDWTVLIDAQTAMPLAYAAVDGF